MGAAEAFISATIVTTILGLGLSLRAASLRQWMRRPALPLRVLCSSCVLIPLLGLAWLHTPWSWSIGRPLRFAVALMTLCPSAPLALHKARSLGGDHQLAALVQVGAALLAILTIPLLGQLYRWSFAVDGWQVLPRHVALQVSVMQVFPLLLGLTLRQWRPALADRIAAPLNRLANTLLILLLLLVLIGAGPMIRAPLRGRPVVLMVMLPLAAAALLIGRGMAGFHTTHGRTTAVVSAMRNPGLALLFANAHGQELTGISAGNFT